MFEEFKNIKAIAFDFGGTLDVPGVHWFDFFWSQIQEGRLSELGITRDQYYDAYVFAERKLEKVGIPGDTSIHDLLRTKYIYQLQYLQEHKIIALNEEDALQLATSYGSKASTTVDINLACAKEVLESLHSRYKVYIVSNYYGNLETILQQAKLLPSITKVFDSTIVGIRKPDPAIWRKALEECGCKPEEFLIVGDSMKNDILPAQSLGCPTVLINQNDVEEYKGIRLKELTALLQIL